MTELTIAQSNPAAPTRAGKTRAHTCLHCKKKYVNKRRHLNEGIKFCSRECSFAHKAEKAELKYSKVFFSTCVVCAKAWAARRSRATCSSKCEQERVRRYSRERFKAQQALAVASRAPIPCKVCGELFKPMHGASELCSKQCANKFSGHNATRAKAYGVDRGYFNERRILVRDKWRCKLCGVKTPEKLRGKNLPNSPEIDHIIPLSQGGPHRQHNVQCACRACNIKKGARPLGQLIMPGFADH